MYYGLLGSTVQHQQRQAREGAKKDGGPLEGLLEAPWKMSEKLEKLLERP